MNYLYSGKLKFTLLLIMLLVGFTLFLVRALYVGQIEKEKEAFIEPQGNSNTSEIYIAKGPSHR